mmetsp:Transcript_24220/g.33960  ORF Transcript_24220/g.33960 Transcript_24220/m.33960 type:complete len:719 (-) Transcript_24220:67-2223(-)
MTEKSNPTTTNSGSGSLLQASSSTERQRRASIADEEVIKTGRELERIKEAEKKGLPLTQAQRKLVTDNTFTLNRKVLEAYQYLSKISEIEQWLCDVFGIQSVDNYIQQRYPELANSTTRQHLHEISHFGQSIIVENFHLLLRDGVLLCNLVNKIKPNIIKRINTNFGSKINNKLTNFKMMENHLFFLEALKQLGLEKQGELFSPTDLFEFKNINKVVDVLITLGEVATNEWKFVPAFKRIKLGQLTFSNEEMDEVVVQLEKDSNQDEEDEIPAQEAELSSFLKDVNINYPPAEPQSSKRESTVVSSSSKAIPVKSESSSDMSIRKERSMTIPDKSSMTPEKTAAIEKLREHLDLQEDALDEIIEMQAQREKTQNADAEVEATSPESKKKMKIKEGKLEPRKRSLSSRDVVNAGSRRRNSIDKPPTDYSSLKYSTFKKSRKWNADEIIDRLFLGDADSAADFDQLTDRGITHIVSLIGSEPIYKEHFEYLIIDSLDTGEHDMISNFPKINSFIHKARDSGAVLVHCQKGVSRSSTAVIAYIMSMQNYNFYDAADLVCEKRPVVCPNLGFIKQLQLYESMNFQLQGNSASHEQYQRLKLRSILMDQRILWQEKKSLSWAGEDFETPDSLHVKCKQCHHKLAPTACVINHDGEGHPQKADKCNSTFILPMKWMGDLQSAEDELKCPGCQELVGKRTWSQFNCGCGASSKPGFVLWTDKIEM